MPQNLFTMSLNNELVTFKHYLNEIFIFKNDCFYSNRRGGIRRMPKRRVATSILVIEKAKKMLSFSI